jgi:hypothetical protein
VATTALKTQSTLSVYHQEDSNNMNGLRVKRHHAIAFLVLVNGKCLRMISSYGKFKDSALVGMVLIGLPVLGTFFS